MPETASKLVQLPALFRKNGCLLHLHVDLTLRCPLDCPHCYVAGPRSRDGEMSTQEVLAVLEQAHELKGFFLLISGGEPMLRPDFFEILEAAHRMRFALRVKTTGLYLREPEARRLASLAPIQVDLSIHGATPETHDRFVGMAGAFERAVRAFEALRKAGVYVGVRTNIVPDNLHETFEIERRFDAPGVDYRRSLAVFSRRDGVPLRDDLWLGEAACVSILNPKDRSLPPPPDPRRPLCGAGATGLYVAPNGDVMPCSLWPQRLGNVREGGLRGALERAAAIRRLVHADRSVCMGCPLRAVCAFCPGESVAEGRAPTDPNRVACGLARAEARARGLDDLEPASEQG